MRGKDGVPDLRRGARSKYASVASPEVCLILAKDIQLCNSFSSGILFF
jgi:hypothetical protein